MNYDLLHDGPLPRTPHEWREIPLVIRWCLLTFRADVEIETRWGMAVGLRREAFCIRMQRKMIVWECEIAKWTLDDVPDPSALQIEAIQRCADEMPEWCWPEGTDLYPIAERYLRAWWRKSGGPVDPYSRWLISSEVRG